METRTSTSNQLSSTTPQREIIPGSFVIYGLNGKCQITSLETRQIGAEKLAFYKLEIQKSPLSRSNRQDPAIWIPVATAGEKGLRLPMTPSEVETAFAILSDREFYFPIDAEWSAIQPQLEACIRHEGGMGLAKVTSYLHVLKRKHVVFNTEISRFAELVSKNFTREVSEITGDPIRAVEARMNKCLKHKLIPDT